MNEVQRRVEVQPAVAEGPRLQTVRFGTATTSTPPGSSSRAASSIGVPGVGQVLERVPEDDCGPLPLEVAQGLVPHVRAARIALQADRLAPVTTQRIDQHTLTRPHVEHRPGGRDPVTRPASSARVRLSTASPMKLKRPDSGRYQVP